MLHRKVQNYAHGKNRMVTKREENPLQWVGGICTSMSQASVSRPENWRMMLFSAALMPLFAERSWCCNSPAWHPCKHIIQGSIQGTQDIGARDFGLKR